MRCRFVSGLSLILVGVGGCEPAERESATPPVVEVRGRDGTVESVDLRDWDARLGPEELERARLDPAWRRVATIDSTGVSPAPAINPETFDSISLEAVNAAAMRLPLDGSAEGPSVLRAQILLDRALFSPGIIDGHWGMNTEKAVYWFQRREGLPTTGRLNGETFERLAQRAGGPPELVAGRQLTEDDVAGPFVTIPEDIQAKADLDCLCYESLSEKLAETYHTSPGVLEALNPGIDLDSLTAGSTLNVPLLRDANAGREVPVHRLVISADGFHLHALDAAGSILFHFPTTLGSSFDPSPEGNHRVTKITREPWWHFQPAILEHVDSSEPDAMIPPGPNNAVGVVWMALSIPHYGIHGTSAPETIGYTTSAGCVRLTNWDASFLSDRIAEGTPVEFSSAESRPGS